jgi:hypothetical protein
MDTKTTFERDDEAIIEFHSRTWRWKRVTRRQAGRRRWALFTVGLLLALGLAVFVPGSTLDDSDAYHLAHAAIAANRDVAEQFGAPLTTGTLGMPGRGVEVAESDGVLYLQFGVAGPKGTGTAYLEARSGAGRWEIDHLVVENDNGARIQIR